jgi:hypothetical protein
MGANVGMHFRLNGGALLWCLRLSSTTAVWGGSDTFQPRTAVSHRITARRTPTLGVGSVLALAVRVSLADGERSRLRRDIACRAARVAVAGSGRTGAAVASAGSSRRVGRSSSRARPAARAHSTGQRRPELGPSGHSCGLLFVAQLQPVTRTASRETAGQWQFVA